MATAIDIKRVLLRNTAWNYAGFVLNVATNLVMFPFVVNRLGDAAAGVWLLLSSVVGYMGLLELGIVPSLAQTTAASRAKDEPDAVSRASSTALAVLIAMAASSLLLLRVVPSLVRILGISEELRSDATLAFNIAIIGFALRMPQATLQGILLGYQRQDRCNQLWIVMGLTKLGAAVLVLTAGYGLVGLVLMETVVHLLAAVFQIAWVRSEDPALRLTWRFVNRADARRLLSFGGAILGVSMSSLIIEQTDRIVIAAFLPVAMVTYYGAAWKVYMLSFTLTTTLVQAVSSVAADLHGRGDSGAVRHLFLRSTKYTVAIAWPLVYTLSFAGGFLLKIWMGERFVGALPVVQVLLVGFAITAHNHAGYSALVAKRRVAPTIARYFAPQAVLNLLLSLWLVDTLGIMGVALGTLIPSAALEYFFLSFVLSELDVTWREFQRRAVRPAAFSALVSYLPLMLAYSQLDVTSPLLPAVAGVCSLTYAVLFWRTLEAGERRAIVDHVAAALRRPAATTPAAAALATQVGDRP